MRPSRLSVNEVARRQWVGTAVGLSLITALWLATMGIMNVYPTAIGPALLATAMLVGLAVLRPHIAFGAAIVAATLGDAVATPWWPATKNLSSIESILYVSGALQIKPFDIVLIAVAATVILEHFLNPSADTRLSAGPLARPMLAFTVSIVIGLAWGVGRGGDLRIAYFESFPLLYVPLAYWLATNLFTSLAHYRRLMIAVVIALSLESLYMIANLEDIHRIVGDDQSVFEHAAAIHFNLAILITLAVGWFGAKRRWPRPLLWLALIPILYVYIDGQRRAGIVSLLIGAVVLTTILYARDKRRFMRTVPLLALVGMAYTAAFWNSPSEFAFPAQAVKSVVQPDNASESDSQSDLYRDMENLNLNATIRSNPVLGIGFGQKFLQPIPLPDIGFAFEFADYITHNNVLWLWAKTGILGFLSFMYMTGLALARGVRASTRLVRSTDVSVIAPLVAYVPMAIVMAYVDISLDPTTMSLFAISLAAASGAENLQAVATADRSTDSTESTDQRVEARSDPAGTSKPTAGIIQS